MRGAGYYAMRPEQPPGFFQPKTPEPMTISFPESDAVAIAAAATLAGENTAVYLTRIIKEAVNIDIERHATWETRQTELRQWDDDALESRSDYLFDQYKERGLSPDDDRELKFVNRLLNERAEAEDAKAIAA